MLQEIADLKPCAKNPGNPAISMKNNFVNKDLKKRETVAFRIKTVFCGLKSMKISDIFSSTYRYTLYSWLDPYL